ncbi:hypothetical protein ColTof4_14127 [Colletotrichum tofieldiae]|uniref:Uncharacterized protein n=1 Tax=Colletotrichum tofieldiae TaxID=708197 RepID=A0A166WKT6_9PEZI|nr:hypothetical protein CT0861_05325 [Colletotrichum tofieldiae]GKT55615.1 hypothetical protein ColTof3_02954 [Colletotrichum tofieldiae]GKT81704.1 hypothetical protein ColTof4_14127 [Colletotrichum tofieldiae]GKT82725.1 hypothetical protein Ct61P_00575 [Colletotrichum tofieldiae]
MAPVSPISNALSGAAAALTPTRTLPQSLPDILARQVVTTVTATPETTEESASDNNLSGGAIAGIVIGSIAGFLLLLWIVKSCGMWSRPNDWAEKDSYDDRRYRGRSPGARHRRRHQHRYHHETSRSRHHHPSYEINEVRYSQPVVYEKRRASASPVPPANVYRSSRSRTRY